MMYFIVTCYFFGEGDGWGEDLDCEVPLFHVGWMLSTVYVIAFTVRASLIIRSRFVSRHDFEDEDLVDNRPVKTMKGNLCSRCPCFRNSSKGDFETEMSVSQPAGEEL